MSGEHARPTSALFRPRSDREAEASPRVARHRRRGGLIRRLRRKLFAYRDIEFLSTHIPGDPGPEEERLLLVHIRRVVGQVHYRTCGACAEGVITGIDIDDELHSAGLGTRALSHLRSRHPGITWRCAPSLRPTTRDLLRRTLAPTTDVVCTHAGVPAAPAHRQDEDIS
ncbi:hypothetical protein ACFWUQ_23535 [Streptomyces sp. NPDC058662]|uniref:hypothetical protein n=1 Tax=Streptomyces sp. NPDC058662 TaxID=3346583 RepID=UPI00364DBDBB